MKATQKHYVITVGASAGGLEAIQEFFDHMPQTGNMSFVVIQHLSPDYKSLLVDLVGRRTDMKVLEAAHDMPVLPNSVYVIPNNKQIRMQRGKLLLSDKVNDKAPNNAIDVFLHSLAIDKKDQAIAVILSGTGTDGTRGIAAIKENGGCVMVQVPNSAKFDGMPNSALASGYADVVDTPAGIAEAIVKEIFETEQHQNLKAKEPDEHTLSKIFELIYKYVGHDFHYYKTPTIIRRIGKRMLQRSIEEPEDFVRLLEGSPDECKELAHDFLISVTKFFRDADAYKVLSEKVLPELIASKESGEQLKVWVSACSTGEEAYSIAMAIDQVLEETGKEIEVKIFASDIDTANLDIASNALYPFSIESDVPEALLSKYFVKRAKGWSVSQRLRKQIVFARHDITKDPPFIKNDLVTCRNMLIYMNNVLQDRIYAMLQFSLNKDGFLFLGPSENPPFSKSSSMQQISMKWKIFKKLADVKQRVNFGESLSTPIRMPRQNVSAHVDIGTKGQKDLWKEMRAAFLEDLGYIAFYIDRNFEIHETMGNYDELLSLPKKMLNLNLVRMLPQDLSLIVNREVRKAWKLNKPVHLHYVVFGKGDNTRAVNILLKPSVIATGHDYTLVMFSKAVAQEARTVEVPETEHDYDYVRNLEAELAETKNSLQLAVEDLETANEELQSSNEELLSSNEELQSSNEELQSLNEELYTLNTEHQVKIKELVELNDDMNNYFRSTNIAQIFLDAQLNIRKFNPASIEIINFIESDLGRPFSDITANFKYNQLLDDIRQVERTRQVVEKEVTLHQGKNFLLRIMPYITREKKYAGIIITFVDITTITNLNNIIRSVFNATTSAIFALHTVTDQRGTITDFIIDAANEKAQEWFGTSNLALTNKSLRSAAPMLTTQELFADYLSVAVDDVKLHRDIVLEGMDMWFELTAAKMPDGLVVTFTDITDKKKAVQKIRKNYSELNDVKENLRKLNKELEDKVKDRTRELSFSEERFRLVARATNDTLWDWDLTADRVWWSDSFRKTFGYTQTQTTRKEWLDHIHPEDVDAVKKSVHAAIHDDHHQWSQEYRFRKADGEYANVLDRGYILHNEFSVPYRMLGSMLDLTALRKAEQEIKMMNEVLEEKVKQRTEQLQAMNQELESSNRDLQLFASVASHDLQEPLRKIHMLTKMVKDRHDGELGDDTVMYLNKIMQSATRMKALVNNILHFSKLSNDFSGFEKTDVAQIIKDVREDFEMVIRDKNAEIRVSEIPQLEVIKPHIQQVFQNLIGNALKFSRKDVPPVITISAWRVNERSMTALPNANGRWCHIEVKDNGIGFDEQFKTRIFDLFQRLNSKDKFEGTGIGLAIVKKIVDKHNGLIAANSREGNGAVFSIILPLEQSSR